MFGNLTGWHLLILVLVVLLLFGAPKLPGLARSVGQSMRIFRKEVRTLSDERAADTANDEDGTFEDDEPVAEAKTAPARKPRSASTRPKS